MSILTSIQVLPVVSCTAVVSPEKLDLLLGTEAGAWREQNFLQPWTSICWPTLEKSLYKKATSTKPYQWVFVGGVRKRVPHLFSWKSCTVGQGASTLWSQQEKFAPSSCYRTVLLRSLGRTPSAEPFLRQFMLVTGTRDMTLVAFFLGLFFTKLSHLIFCTAYWFSLIREISLACYLSSLTTTDDFSVHKLLSCKSIKDHFLQ